MESIFPLWPPNITCTFLYVFELGTSNLHYRVVLKFHFFKRISNGMQLTHETIFRLCWVRYEEPCCSSNISCDIRKIYSNDICIQLEKKVLCRRQPSWQGKSCLMRRFRAIKRFSWTVHIKYLLWLNLSCWCSKLNNRCLCKATSTYLILKISLLF